MLRGETTLEKNLELCLTKNTSLCYYNVFLMNSINHITLGIVEGVFDFLRALLISGVVSKKHEILFSCFIISIMISINYHFLIELCIYNTY